MCERCSESGRNVTNVLLAMALCLVSVALTHSAGPATPNWNTPPAQDFPLAGGSYSNQRYSALSRINRSNITKLGGIWSMRVEEPHRGGTLDGTPVVVDGVMYVTTGARNVLALDVKTGDVKWRYRPESEEGKTGANKGVVVADGKVVFGRRDNMLIALDQHTGRLVWQKQTTYPMGTGSGLLSTAGGLIFHGESDGNLVAYDIRNGEELWKFQTGAGANGPVSTFEADGEQYVAVMAGGNNILLSPRGDFLWTFKLGGTLPQAPPGRQPPLIHPAPPQRQP